MNVQNDWIITWQKIAEYISGSRNPNTYSTETVRRWNIPVKKIGTYVRIEASKLDDWLQKHDREEIRK